TYTYPDATPALGFAQAWHYMRASNTDPLAAPPQPLRGWHFVHPGRYDASNSLVAPPWNPTMRPRQAGTFYTPRWSTPAEQDPWDLTSTTTPGGLAPSRPLHEMTLGETYG